MKANEAPEKIILTADKDSEEISYYWVIKTYTDNIKIEYSRTDAFIEKAVKFLKKWDAYRVCLEGHKDWFIEQFKNYMKGE